MLPSIPSLPHTTCLLFLFFFLFCFTFYFSACSVFIVVLFHDSQSRGDLLCKELVWMPQKSTGGLVSGLSYEAQVRAGSCSLRDFPCGSRELPDLSPGQTHHSVVFCISSVLCFAGLFPTCSEIFAEGPDWNNVGLVPSSLYTEAIRFSKGIFAVSPGTKADLLSSPSW